MKIAELFVFLGFKVDDTQLKNFDDGVKNLTENLDLTKIAAVAAVYAMDQFIQSSIMGAVALYNFTQQTGESVQALQEWQAAAHSANPALGIDQIAQSMQNFDNSLVELKTFGQGNAQPFWWLGIDPRQVTNAADFLEKARDKIQGLNRPLAVNLLRKAGFDAGFINILTRSRQEFDAFIKGTTLSDPAIHRLEKLGEKISNFKLQLVTLKSEFIDALVPTLSKAIDLFENLGHNIAAISDSAGFKMIDWVHGLTAAIGLLVLELSPLTRTITALLLLIDDLYVYSKGGKSLTGEAVNGLKKFLNVKDGKSSDEESIPTGTSINDPGNRPITVDDIKDVSSRLRPGARYPSLSANSTSDNSNSSVQNNYTVNNDIIMQHPDHESGAEAVVRKTQAAMDTMEQRKLNHALTDQSYVGSGN